MGRLGLSGNRKPDFASCKLSSEKKTMRPGRTGQKPGKAPEAERRKTKARFLTAELGKRGNVA